MARADLELWSDYPCAEGTRLAPIVPIASGRAQHRVDSKGLLRATVPLYGVYGEALWWSGLPAIGQIIRHTDAYGYLHFWRISRVKDARGGSNDRVLEITARPPLYDLKRIYIRQINAETAPDFNIGIDGASPAQIRDTFILPYLPWPWVTAGTWTPTAKTRIPFDAFTVLELLAFLEEATGYEADLRPDGDDGFLLDLATINGDVTTNPADLRRSVIEVQREQTDEELYTVIIPRGMQAQDEIQAATLAYATWEVVSVTADTPTPGLTTVTLADRDGGAGPIAYDFQFGGHGLDGVSNHWMLLPDATLLEIIDCREADQSMVLDGSGVTVDDDVEIRADFDGTHLVEVLDPVTYALYDRLEGEFTENELRGERNHVPNSFGSRVTTPPIPDKWNELNSAVVESQPAPAGETAEGAANGAQASTLSLLVDGFPADHVVYKGDSVYGAGTNSAPVADDVTLDGSGAGTITLGVAITVSDDEVLTTLRPDLSQADAGVLVTHVEADGLARDLDSDPYTIKLPPGTWDVHYRIGVSVFNTDNTNSQSAAGLDLGLWDDTPTEIDSTAEGSFSVAALATTHKVIGDTVQLSGDQRLNLGFDANTTARVSTHVRWMMIHIGPTKDIPAVEYSNATPIHQLGNALLLGHSTPATTYDMTMRTLGLLGCHDPAKEVIRRGVTVPVEVDLFGSLTTRAIEVDEDLVDHELTRVELGTRRTQGSDRIKTQRYTVQRIGDTAAAQNEVSGPTVQPAVEEIGAARAIVPASLYNASGGVVTVEPYGDRSL